MRGSLLFAGFAVAALATIWILPGRRTERSLQPVLARARVLDGDEFPRMGMNVTGFMDADVGLDVVSGSQTHGVAVLRQVVVDAGPSKKRYASGAFVIEPVTGLGGAVRYFPRSNDCGVFDFNGDGDLDIAMFICLEALSDERLVIFENTGYGTNWTIKEIFQDADVMFFSHDLELADFDQDGNTDLCINSIDPRDPGTPDRNRNFTKVDVFWNPGSWLKDWDRDTVGQVGTQLGGEWGLAVADLNPHQDSCPDIVAHDRIFTAPGGRSGGWSGAAYTDENPSTIVVADVDGDGYLDIATAEGHSHRDGEGDVYVHFQRPSDRTFPRDHRLRLHEGRGTDKPDDDDRLNMPEGLAGLDEDGDGRLETWFYPEFGDFDWNAPSGGHVWKCKIDFRKSRGGIPYGIQNDGGGPGEDFPQPIETAHRIGHQMIAADIDNDGDLDLLLHNVGATEAGIESFAIYYR